MFKVITKIATRVQIINNKQRYLIYLIILDIDEIK